MVKDNLLLLLSGNDIPFVGGRLTMRQPRLREIAYIGETNFVVGCQTLFFNKEKLGEADKTHLENMSNFEILMSIMREKNPVVQKNKLSMIQVLSLIFPTYEVQLDLEKLEIKLVNQEKEDDIKYINNSNFEEFKENLEIMFCLGSSREDDYNPSGEMATKIAEKLRNRKTATAIEQVDNKPIAILSRYVSILAVGECKDMNLLFDYTVYQITEEFNRFQLKMAYDSNISFRLAGATGMEAPEEWMTENVHRSKRV